MTSDVRAVGRRDDGSTLLLVPVGLLIMFVLGAIAVDSAIMFSAKREVVEIASGLANDAAAAVNLDELYRAAEEGRPLLTAPVDRDRLARLVARTVQGSGARLAVSCDVAVLATEIEVTCRGVERALFRPGRDRTVPVSATVAAVLEPPPNP